MSQVIRAEDLLRSQSGPSQKKTVNSKKTACSESSSESEDDGNFAPMRGRIVSGRVWKSQKKRASSVIKTPGIRLSFAQKQNLREEKKRIKEMSKALEEEFNQAKLAKKKRRADNIKKAEENERKNEVVQVIKNSMKIKKMRKTQLRKIEKRDTTEIK